MAEDLISRYIDRASFEADTKFARAQLEALESDFKALRDSRVNLRNASGTGNIADEIKQARLETEQLKQKNLELNAAIKEQRIEAAKLRADRKAAADEEKLRIENEKKAAAERRALEIEKNRSLAEQKKRQEELAEIERQRLETERQRIDLGTFEIPQGSGQSGYGKITRPNSQPFVPQTERESSILYLSQLQAGLKRNTEAQKELQAQLKAGTITQAEFDKSIVQAKLKEVKYREIIKQTSAEIKARAAAELSVKGTIDAARAENALLIKQRDQIPVGDFADPEDIARVKELNEQIDRNNDLIQKNVDALGQQKINIGNYPTAFGSAFKTLNKELDDVQSKIASGAFKGKELDQLTQKLNVLQRATGLTGKEFTSSAAEAKAYKESAIQIGQVYGKNSDVFKQFSADVKKGNVSIKEFASGTVEAASKGKGFLGFLSMAWSGIRKLAYLVPGLGIAGVFSLMLIPIQSVGAAIIKSVKKSIEGLDTLSEAAKKRIKEITKADNEIRESAIKTSTSQIVQLNRLKDVITDTTKNQNERMNAAKAYNKIADEGNKIDLTQIDNIGKINASIANQIRLIEKRALTTASEKILSDKAEKLLLAQEKAREKAIKEQENEDTYNIQTVNSSKIDSYFTNAERQLEIRRKIAKDEAVKTAQAEFDAAKVAAQAYFGQGFFDKVDVSHLKNAMSNADSLLEQFRIKNLKAIAQYSQENLKILQDLYKEQMNDQDDSEQDRLSALQKFHDVSLELLKKQKEEQEKLLSSEIDKAKSDAAKITNAKLRADTLIEIENYQTNQLKVINQQFGNDVSKLDKETATQRVAISQQAWNKIMTQAKEAAEFVRKQQEEAYKNILRQADIDKYDELMALQDAYQKGSIKSIEEYNQKRQEIEDRANEKQKKAELERLKVQEKIFEALFGIQNLDIIKQIKALEFEITESGNKKILDADKALFDAQKDLNERKKELLQSGLDAVSEIASAQFERQNEIDEAKFKKQQEDADREKALVEASTLSQEEKEARIKMIDERTEARQRVLEERQRQRAIQQAKFEKAMAILNIGVKTAETVFSIAAKAAVAPIPLKPAILAQIPWVLGMSALEIGLILAKPIPKFKHGKHNNYEGPAIVGDGGVSEFVVRKDGAIEKTPARDTLTYVGKDDIVYPNLSSFLRAIATPALGGLPKKPNSERNNIAELKPYLERIANKRELRLQSDHAGMQAIWKWGSRQVKYVNQNTNW